MDTNGHECKKRPGALAAEIRVHSCSFVVPFFFCALGAFSRPKFAGPPAADGPLCAAPAAEVQTVCWTGIADRRLLFPGRTAHEAQLRGQGRSQVQLGHEDERCRVIPKWVF